MEHQREENLHSLGVNFTSYEGVLIAATNHGKDMT